MKQKSLKQTPQEDLQQPPAQKVNILLVDDNPDNLYALEVTLGELGENLVLAESGKDALKQLLNREFAVILLDVQMPDMDGYETATLIRKRKKSEKVPIIFVSAFDREDQQILKGYETGAVDYILKPFNFMIVKSKVKVFVDLYRMREEIVSHKEKEAEQLREALESYKLLTDWQESWVSVSTYSVDPLQKRAANTFATFEQNYASLLDEYLEGLAFSEKPSGQKISQIAESMGKLSAGPRDVAQLHTNCVSKKIKEVNHKHTHAYTLKGHLLAFEVMGYLVDFYRLQGPLIESESDKETK